MLSAKSVESITRFGLFARDFAVRTRDYLGRISEAALFWILIAILLIALFLVAATKSLVSLMVDVSQAIRPNSPSLAPAVEQPNERR